MLLHECFDFGLLETAGSCWFGFLAGFAVARDTVPPAGMASTRDGGRAWWRVNLAPAGVVLLAAIAGVASLSWPAPGAASDSSRKNGPSDLLRAAAQDPRNPTPLLDAADLALKTGDSVTAERLTRLALARQPGLAQARLRLAEALLQQGRRDAARQIVQPLIPFYNGRPQAEKLEAKDELDRLVALARALKE